MNAFAFLMAILWCRASNLFSHVVVLERVVVGEDARGAVLLGEIFAISASATAVN